MKREIDLSVSLRLLNNGPLVLVGTVGERGYDATPVAWCVPAAKEPPTAALFLSPGHLCWENIRTTGVFTLNLPGKSLLRAVAFLGGVSGRKLDKIAACGLDAIGGKFGEAPVFPDCLAMLECRLLDMDEHTHLVRGEVLYAIADEEAFFDHWRIGQGFFPLQHLGGEYYQCGNEELMQPRLQAWE